MPEDLENHDIAAGRARLYFFISRVFLKEMDKNFLKGLKQDGFIDSIREMGFEPGEEFFDKNEDEVIERLAEEYAELFIVPGGLSLCESVWLKGLLFQEPASKAMDFYKRCGFKLPEDFKGFPDQLGVELSFMGHLAQEEANSWKEGKHDYAQAYRELEKRFLKHHLAKWVYPFCRSVERYASKPFYREMARFALSFLESEAEDMGVEIKKDLERDL